MSSLLIAVQFLTLLPVPPPSNYTPLLLGRSLLWYPVVGGLLGALLWAVAGGLSGAPLALQAALLLTLWVALSGALHLDGLADTADAWLGGLGDRERTLALMKDPCCGPLAVVVLVLVLLLKFTALFSLLAQGHAWVLCWVLMAGRAMPLLLLLTTPYVRSGGLGETLSQHLPQRPAWGVLSGSALLLGVAGGGWIVGCILGVWLWARRALLQRLGGTTGDTLGAMVELVETLALVVWALQLS